MRAAGARRRMLGRRRPAPFAPTAAPRPLRAHPRSLEPLKHPPPRAPSTAVRGKDLPGSEDGGGRGRGRGKAAAAASGSERGSERERGAGGVQ